jgi:hypothetical protein
MILGCPSKTIREATVIHVESGLPFPAGVDLSQDGFQPIVWAIRTESGAMFHFSRLLLPHSANDFTNLFVYSTEAESIVVKFALFDCVQDMRQLVYADDELTLAVVPCKFVYDARIQIMPLLDGDMGTLLYSMKSAPPIKDFMRFIVAQCQLALSKELMYCDFKLENLLWRENNPDDLSNAMQIDVVFGDIESFILLTPDNTCFATYPFRKMAAQTKTEMYENMLYGFCFLALAYYASCRKSSVYRSCSYEKMVWRHDKSTAFGFMYKQHPYKDMVTTHFPGRPILIRELETYLSDRVAAMHNKSIVSKRKICDDAIETLLSDRFFGKDEDDSDIFILG